ncbi:hypothetical protein MICRO116_720006 [Micrococcus sp. 116]|nr:hypothetical protein MICRO116_720006 [Micrococcus sp. 116]
MIPQPTDRLTFRCMTDADLDDMCRLLGDAEVMRYYPRAKSRNEVQRWTRPGRGRSDGPDAPRPLLGRRRGRLPAPARRRDRPRPAARQGLTRGPPAGGPGVGVSA